MKIKVIIPFNDLEEKVFRQVGEEFEVSKERGEQIVSNGYAEEIKGLPKINNDKKDKKSKEK